VENRDLASRVGPLQSHTPSREVSTLTVIPVLRIADGRCWCTGRRRMVPCRACERVAIVAGASRISRRGLHRRLARFRAGGDSSLRGRRSGPGGRRRRRSHIARPPCSRLALGCGTGRRGRSPRRFTPRGRSLEAWKGTRSHCRQASIRPRESGCEQHGPRRLVGRDRVAVNGHTSMSRDQAVTRRVNIAGSSNDRQRRSTRRRTGSASMACSPRSMTMRA
jgi:hypothetical protein